MANSALAKNDESSSQMALGIGSSSDRLRGRLVDKL